MTVGFSVVFVKPADDVGSLVNVAGAKIEVGLTMFYLCVGNSVNLTSFRTDCGLDPGFNVGWYLDVLQMYKTSLVCPFQHYRTDKCLRFKYERCFSSKNDSTVGSHLNNCSAGYDWQTARPSGFEFIAVVLESLWRLKWFSLEILLSCFTVDFHGHSRLTVMKFKVMVESLRRLQMGRNNSSNVNGKQLTAVLRSFASQ